MNSSSSCCIISCVVITKLLGLVYQTASKGSFVLDLTLLYYSGLFKTANTCANPSLSVL